MKIVGSVQFLHVIEADPDAEMPNWRARQILRQLDDDTSFALRIDGRIVTVCYLSEREKGTAILGLTIGAPARPHLVSLIRFARLTAPEIIEAMLPEVRVLAVVVETQEGLRLARLAGFKPVARIGAMIRLERNIQHVQIPEENVQRQAGASGGAATGARPAGAGD